MTLSKSKLAIHVPSGYGDRWITYCQQHRIEYKIVNCFRSDILHQLYDCYALLWHWTHGNGLDGINEIEIIKNIEESGIRAYPSSDTCATYNSKIKQYYQLSKLKDEFVSTFLSFDQEEVRKFIDETNYPKVFKLSKGAGSETVRLLSTKRQATRLANKMFNKGIKSYDAYYHLKELRWKILRDKKIDLVTATKAFGRLVFPNKIQMKSSIEKGYFYLQKFLPDNKYDIRVYVVWDKAIGIRRFVRANDFRASGSGSINYDMEKIDSKIVKRSFSVAKLLGMDTCAIDYVYDGGSAKILEVSYCVNPPAYYQCEGVWNERLEIEKFNDKRFYVQDLIIEEFLKRL